MAKPTPEPTVASLSLPPFDTGDIIVRSVDGEDFIMYRLDLSRASPVFNTMLTLPQSSASLRTNTKDGLPVIQLAEPASVLGPLLALCLPMRRPNRYFADVASVAHVMEAAQKYEMEWLIDVAREVLRGWMETEPIRVYAVACRFGLREDANLAAKLCLRLPAETILACQAEELQFLTVTQFRFLVKYRDDCQKAVEKYIGTTASGSSVSVEVDVWSGERYCRTRGSRHNLAWRTRYIDALTRTLGACTWEGAVGLEQVVATWMEVPREELCAKPECLRDLQAQWSQISKKVAEGIARVIAKHKFDMQQYPKSAIGNIDRI